MHLQKLRLFKIQLKDNGENDNGKLKCRPDTVTKSLCQNKKNKKN